MFKFKALYNNVNGAGSLALCFNGDRVFFLHVNKPNINQANKFKFNQSRLWNCIGIILELQRIASIFYSFTSYFKISLVVDNRCSIRVYFEALCLLHKCFTLDQNRLYCSSFVVANILIFFSIPYSPNIVESVSPPLACNNTSFKFSWPFLCYGDFSLKINTTYPS